MDMTQQTLISNLLNFCWILSNNINFIYCFIVTFKVWNSTLITTASCNKQTDQEEKEKGLEQRKQII